MKQIYVKFKAFLSLHRWAFLVGILIVSGATLPTNAFASTLYQNWTGGFDLNQSGTTFFPIGTFVGDGTYLNNQSQVGALVNMISLGNCGEGAGVAFGLNYYSDLAGHAGDRYDFHSPSPQSGEHFITFTVPNYNYQLENGHTYTLFMRRDSGYSCDFSVKVDGSQNVYGYFISNGSVPTPPPSDTTTHFISVSPANGSTVSTSSPSNIGAHVYINPSDYVDGMYLQFSFTNQTLSMVGGSALDAWNSATGNGLDTKIFITATSTDLDVSTTTIFSSYKGQTRGMYKIVKPTFWSSLWGIGWMFNGDVLVSTTTNFVLGEKTTMDIAVENNDLTTWMLTGSSTASSTPILDCNLTSFDVGKCLTSVIVPSPTAMGQLGKQIYSQVLTAFPLGYITRFVTILSSQTAVEPPPLSYSFGSSSPSTLQTITANDPIYFQIFDHFDVLTTIKSDQGTNHDIWDIVMPFFRVVVSVAVLFVILTDLLGFSFESPDQEGAGRVRQVGKNLYDGTHKIKVNDYSNLSEDEWNTMKRNRLL